MEPELHRFALLLEEVHRDEVDEAADIEEERDQIAVEAFPERIVRTSGEDDEDHQGADDDVEEDLEEVDGAQDFLLQGLHQGIDPEDREEYDRDAGGRVHDLEFIQFGEDAAGHQDRREDPFDQPSVIEDFLHSRL